MNDQKKALASSTLPLLPLRDLVAYPSTVLTVDVGRERSVSAVERALEHEGRLFAVAQKNSRAEHPSEEDLYTVGCIVTVRQVLRLPDGSVRLLLQGETRAALLRVWEDADLQLAECLDLPSVPVSDPLALRARMRAVKRMAANLGRQSTPRLSRELLDLISGERDADALADVVSANLLHSLEKRQALLEITDPLRRLDELAMDLGEEKKLNELEERIHERVRQAMDKANHDYYLREEIRVIQEELGEEEDEELVSLRKRLKESPISGEARERVEKEISKLARTSINAPESAMLENYIEFMLELPWGKKSEGTIDLRHARRVLEGDHYGMKEIKERLLEYLAVLKARKALCAQTKDASAEVTPPESAQDVSLRSPILCLVGPPGVGKTSIARSVARALHREFAQMSLGGVNDESEIRGHRRTYIGALPGRILSAIRQCKSMNPVFLLDEVDKLSRSLHGDPASALLEVLDPEQNACFRDHYAEAPFDLSDVLFITTANSQDTIDRALLDRMEIIEVPSYTLEEKVQIAKRYLLPKQLKAHGLSKAQLRVNDRALKSLIDLYTREAGVRTLERTIAKICRKAVLRFQEQPDLEKIALRAEDLSSFLEAPLYPRKPESEKSRVGRVNGLAWTSVGGEVMPVEALFLEGKGEIRITGKLGEVMKESAQLAVSAVRARLGQYKVDSDFFQKHDLHIHVPEGAVPKDGPSAGVALTCAILSAASGLPARADLAMTGEITLLGDVLPIGGVKEKLLAAYRAGIKTILLPRENERDLQKIDPEILRQMQLVLLDRLEDALPLVLSERREIRVAV